MGVLLYELNYTGTIEGVAALAGTTLSGANGMLSGDVVDATEILPPSATTSTTLSWIQVNDIYSLAGDLTGEWTLVGLTSFDATGADSHWNYSADGSVELSSNNQDAIISLESATGEVKHFLLHPAVHGTWPVIAGGGIESVTLGAAGTTATVADPSGQLSKSHYTGYTDAHDTSVLNLPCSAHLQPVTDAAQMDELHWCQVSDQFGTVDATGGDSDWYTDLTVETIDGVTYVVMTSSDGDVELYRYNTDTCDLTLLATHTGTNGTANETLYDLNDPQILSVNGKIAIVGGDENGHIMAYTYDPALGDSTVDNDNRLVEETTFETDIWGKGQDESFQFVAGNGETYVLFQQADGAYDGGQVTTDVSGNLIFDHQVISGRDASNQPENILIQEEHSTLMAGNQPQGVNGASYVQIDDYTVYEYAAGAYSATRGSALKIVKWEVDPATGELSASQVLYEDGTTYQDMKDAGYSNPYPSTSPFDPTAAFLDKSYLYDVSGLVGQNTSSTTDGVVDEGQLSNLMITEAFTVGDKQYLFVGAYSAGGASIYEIDPATGMPSTFIDHVESAASTTADSDDGIFSFGEEFNDVTIQVVDATGEIVITALSHSSAVHFQFDPAGGHSSIDPNNTGALTWIGTEGVEKPGTSAFNIDTDGQNFLGYTNTALNNSFLNGYEILPDGKVLAVNAEGAWIADPGVSEVGGAVVCFTAGTKIRTAGGLKPVEELEQGDLVWTKDDGYQPIRWIGQRSLTAVGLAKNPHLRPIKIAAGAFGHNIPKRDLSVSPQHRMLVKSRIAHRMADTEEVLVAAKHLLQIDGVDVDHSVENVTYVHFLFDRHQIVKAEGAESESLFTGPEALKAVSQGARSEIFELFPELLELNHDSLVSARPLMSGRRSRKLAQRHKQNRKPLYMY